MYQHFGQLGKNPVKYIARREIKRYNSGHKSGRGAVRLARLHGVQEVGGSNPLAPTEYPLKGGFFFKAVASHRGTCQNLSPRLKLARCNVNDPYIS